MEKEVRRTCSSFNSLVVLHELVVSVEAGEGARHCGRLRQTEVAVLHVHVAVAACRVQPDAQLHTNSMVRGAMRLLVAASHRQIYSFKCQ